MIMTCNNIYRSNFATYDSPTWIPERHMPRQIYSRMVTDELIQSANPRLKYAAVFLNS